MLARLKGEVHATIPDLICCLDSQKGTPITNPNFHNDMEVTVVILPAPKEFCTEKGLSIFGPSYVGVDQKFCPAKNISKLKQ